MLQIQDLKEALPPALKHSASQEMVDTINALATDPELAEVLRSNALNYTSVMREGRYKVDEYLNAVAYVSFKLMGHTNQEAYAKAFPGRYQNLVAAGRSQKEISSYVANYNKGKLVNAILEKTLIPVWLLNLDAYQEAINTQVQIMNDPNVNPRDRTYAANSILTHIKKPETHQVELNLGEVTTDGMNELRDSIARLAEQQQEMIAQGVRTQDIAHEKLVRRASPDMIDAEVIESPLEAPLESSSGSTGGDSGAGSI